MNLRGISQDTLLYLHRKVMVNRDDGQIEAESRDVEIEVSGEEFVWYAPNFPWGGLSHRLVDAGLLGSATRAEKKVPGVTCDGRRGNREAWTESMTMATVEDEHGRRDPGFTGSTAADAPQFILPVSTIATAADNGTETSCRGAADKVGESLQSAVSRSAVGVWGFLTRMLLSISGRVRLDPLQRHVSAGPVHPRYRHHVLLFLQLCQPEIRYLGAKIVAQENVLRLDVAVQNSLQALIAKVRDQSRHTQSNSVSEPPIEYWFPLIIEDLAAAFSVAGSTSPVASVNPYPPLEMSFAAFFFAVLTSPWIMQPPSNCFDPLCFCPNSSIVGNE
ncbi:hypothetical protein C1H46_003441 [Malus baccata]|uniref:Uncharacterized protein n=1 Tax=Malus baccata TaxID=106549 RepID=A0A540NJ14_MALBA|nr:hypothetical protein C1H46_003441 [Malus baccata]